MALFAHIVRWRLLAGLFALLAAALLHSAQLPVRLADGPSASAYTYDHKLIRPQAADTVGLVERESASPDSDSDVLPAAKAVLLDVAWGSFFERTAIAANIGRDVKYWAARAPPAIEI